MLVELPRVAIESLVNQYEDIKLSQVDDIMFLGQPASLYLFLKQIRSHALCRRLH